MILPASRVQPRSSIGLALAGLPFLRFWCLFAAIPFPATPHNRAKSKTGCCSACSPQVIRTVRGLQLAVGGLQLAVGGWEFVIVLVVVLVLDRVSE